MSVVSAMVKYEAPCPKCEGPATWTGKNVCEIVPLKVHSTEDFWDDHVIITVECRKCDAKDMRWTA